MKRAEEIIKGCLEEKKMSQRKLAACMGEDVRCLNQQLNRQKDMKVERFVDVLEYIGYRVEIVENDGIRKVSPEYAKQIVESREQRGLFWCFDDEKYIGIDNTTGEAYCEEFDDKNECFKYLRGELCVDASGFSHNE